MSFLQRRLAKQLGDPSGLFGRVVAGTLNKRNRRPIAGAVAALRLEGGETVADIGYGGGIGLSLLLDAVGATGRVHGIDPSPTMVERSRRQLAGAIADDRLVLHRATMAALPFGDGELDGWISLNTIYFIDDLAPSFAELARVLKPTGRGVLGIADPGWLASQPFAEHGFVVRPVAEVVAALEDATLDTSVQTLTDPTTSEAGYHLVVCTRP